MIVTAIRPHRRYYDPKTRKDVRARVSTASVARTYERLHPGRTMERVPPAVWIWTDLEHGVVVAQAAETVSVSGLPEAEALAVLRAAGCVKPYVFEGGTKRPLSFAPPSHA